VVFRQTAEAARQFLALEDGSRAAVLALQAGPAFSVTLASTPHQLAGGTVKRLPVGREELLRGMASVGLAVPPELADAVWRFCRVWQTNALAVEGGSALSVAISRANHSCRPNVFRAEVGPRALALVAAAPIHPGDELCFSYVADLKLLQPKHLRADYLASWFSKCECVGCRDPWEPTRRVRCFRTKRCKGVHEATDDPDDGGPLRPCSRCHAPVPAADLTRLRNTEDAYGELFTAINNAPDPISNAHCQMMVQAMEQCEQLFAADHWLVGRFHGLMVEYEQQRGDHAAARRHATGILTFLDGQLSRPSVRRALQRGELAAVEARRGDRLSAAMQLLLALEEASCLLPPAHGHCADLRASLEKVLAA